MPRNFTPAARAAATASVSRPVLLVRLAYDSADVLVCSLGRNISWDWNSDGVAETFVGVGILGAVSDLEETGRGQASAVSLELNGVDQAALALALLETYQGRDARIWLGFRDGGQLVDAPVLLWRGRMDTQTIDLPEGKITLDVASRLQDWERQRTRRYTDEDQQAAYPGDLGVQFVSRTAEFELIWGNT
jgi:hypothetical protein